MNDENPDFAVHEKASVNSFVTRDKRSRMLALLKDEKRRQKFVSLLPHFQHFDSRCIVDLPGAIQRPSELLRLLERNHAPPNCFVISEDPALDQREMPLRSAIEAVQGFGIGTLLSCIAGELAYYEGVIETRIICEDAGGHYYGPNDPQNRGPPLQRPVWRTL